MCFLYYDKPIQCVRCRTTLEVTLKFEEKNVHQKRCVLFRKVCKLHHRRHFEKVLCRQTRSLGEKTSKCARRKCLAANLQRSGQVLTNFRAVLCRCSNVTVNISQNIRKGRKRFVMILIRHRTKLPTEALICAFQQSIESLRNRMLCSSSCSNSSHDSVCMIFNQHTIFRLQWVYLQGNSIGTGSKNPKFRNT